MKCVLCGFPGALLCEDECRVPSGKALNEDKLLEVARSVRDAREAELGSRTLMREMESDIPFEFLWGEGRM